EDQQSQQQGGLELRDLEVHLSRVDQSVKQKRDMAGLRAELAKLPLDPTAILDREQQEYEKTQLLGQALPLLQQLAGEREARRQARRQARGAADELAAVTARGKELKAAAEDLARQAVTVAEARRQAEEQATAARTRWQLAADELKQLDQVSGEKRCR